MFHWADPNFIAASTLSSSQGCTLRLNRQTLPVGIDRFILSIQDLWWGVFLSASATHCCRSGPITEQHTRTQTGSLCNFSCTVRTCVSTQSDGVDQAMSSSTSCSASAAKIGGRSLILASLKGSKLASSSLTSEDVCSKFNYQWPVRCDVCSVYQRL
jgi:hypothetical protein